MADSDLLYRPPTEPDKRGSESRYRASSFNFEAAGYPGFIALPLVGGFIGFVGYIVAALLLEAQNEPVGPTLSYGQQAGLISLPICTVIGAAIGLGVAFAIVRRHLISIGLLLLASLSSAWIVSSMWNDQITRHGRDPSEVVLYYPPLGFSVLALVAALAVVLVATVRWRARIA